MLNTSIHDNDAETLINTFEGIGTLQEIYLSDNPELRYALANLIGALRTQADVETYNPTPGIHKRVDLEFLMVVKFEEWEAERAEDGCGRSADKALEDCLDNAGLLSHCFCTGNGAASTTASFLAAVEENPTKTYEIKLCTYTDKELETLSLEDMANALLLEQLERG
jgi:hypothetical protein